MFVSGFYHICPHQCTLKKNHTREFLRRLFGSLEFSEYSLGSWLCLVLAKISVLLRQYQCIYFMLKNCSKPAEGFIHEKIRMIIRWEKQGFLYFFYYPKFVSLHIRDWLIKWIELLITKMFAYILSLVPYNILGYYLDQSEST